MQTHSWRSSVPLEFSVSSNWWPARARRRARVATAEAREPLSRLIRRGSMHMRQLPSVMLPNEQKRTPGQGKLAPANGELKRKRDQSHISVALHPEAKRLQVQVGRSRSSLPRFLEKPVPARLDRYLASNAIWSVGKWKKDRRLRRPTCPKWFPIEIVQNTQKSVYRRLDFCEVIR